MYWGAPDGSLEIRRGGGSRGRAEIRGRFPYNSRATLSDGGKSGRPRKEYFASNAFKHSVDSEDQEIFLLSGHDFGLALARKFTDDLSARLKLLSTPDALEFTATLTQDVLETTHGKDLMHMIAAGLISGISPGFRIPPKQTVPDAEEIFEEDPEEGRAIVRKINTAILYELSLVSAPAYKTTDVQVEARSWNPTEKVFSRKLSPRYRWR